MSGSSGSFGIHLGNTSACIAIAKVSCHNLFKMLKKTKIDVL